MTNNTGSKTLQNMVDEVPNLVEHLSNDTLAPHFRARTSLLSSVIPQEFTNWREEQRAWRETAYFFNQSHHMPELFLRGPDAHRLLTGLSINNLSNLDESRAKQFIGCTPSGHIIGDCIAYCHAPDSFELISGMPILNWVHFNAEKGGYDVQVTRDAPTAYNATGRRERYRFQLEGPNAAKIFNEVVDGGAPDIPFFRTARVRIRGHEVLVLRHGMSGHLGAEFSGPYDELEAVEAAFLEAGQKHDMRRGGLKSYFSTVYESGWMPYPLPGIYTGDDLREYREWLPADGWEANAQIGGSFVSSNIEDYYVTPWDLGYGKLLKFKHDFVGKEALQKKAEQANRSRVTLVWHPDDVLKVYASQFGDGPRYKSLEFPVANIGWPHFDEVCDANGKPVGISTHCGYSANDRAALSLAMIDEPACQIGSDVVLTWGEPNGGSRKPHVERHEQIKIRAKVAEAPFSQVAQQMKKGIAARRVRPPDEFGVALTRAPTGARNQIPPQRSV